MQRQDKLSELPPIARAKAMDEPYQPGLTRRRVLVGAVVVATAITVFLVVMQRGAAPPRDVAASPSNAIAPAPVPSGVVYPKLEPLPAPAQSP